MKLVVDSNIFVSSLDPKDKFHNECYPIFEKILTFEIEALSPSIVLVEVTCVLRRRTGSENIANEIYKNLSDLLGHKSSKTTEIYTHVSSKDFMRIRNPLDQMLEEKKSG